MKILVCGGRNFGRLPETKPPHEISPGVFCYVDKKHPDFPARKAEYDFIITKLYEISKPYNYPPDEYDNTLPNVTIIHGGATGADTAADEWAVVNWTGLTEFKVTPEEWKHLGRAAGPIRNQRMIDEGKPDLVVAFPGGTGTADMVRRAKRAGIEVIEFGAGDCQKKPISGVTLR